MTTLIPGLVMLEQVPWGSCSRVGYRPQGTSVLVNKCLNMTLHFTFNNTLHAFCKRRGNSNYHRTILQHHWTAATLTTLAIDQTTICWSSRSLKKVKVCGSAAMNVCKVTRCRGSSSRRQPQLWKRKSHSSVWTHGSSLNVGKQASGREQARLSAHPVHLIPCIAVRETGEPNLSREEKE